MIAEERTTEATVAASVRNFIRENFIFDDCTPLDDEQSLLDSGVVDSTGILELVSFLEEKYGIRFADHELVAENFDSVMKIMGFLKQKLNGQMSKG